MAYMTIFFHILCNKYNDLDLEFVSFRLSCPLLSLLCRQGDCLPVKCWLSGPHSQSDELSVREKGRRKTRDTRRETRDARPETRDARRETRDAKTHMVMA
jgi:hypothetical protein